MRYQARLTRAFYARRADRVAQDLIGCVLVHDASEGRVAGRIVETEAYLDRDDPASHAHPGPTSRNASMFGPPGRAYVYLSYGVHHCFNVVTGAAGSGQAVLVRALEPLEGAELMGRRRGRDAVRELCSGPGKLAQALGIGPVHDGASLLAGALSIRARVAEPHVARGTRVGITKAAELPLRFGDAGSRFLSRPL